MYLYPSKLQMENNRIEIYNKTKCQNKFVISKTLYLFYKFYNEYIFMLMIFAKRNDEIMTSGGILGKVLKVDGDKLSVEIAKGVNVTVLRSTVADVINKK